MTYLVSDLELLASTDVLRLGDSSLEAVESLVVKRLKSGSVRIPFPFFTVLQLGGGPCRES